MPTSLAVIMLLGCIAVFVLLGIAIVLTIDVFRRISKMEELDKQLDKIIELLIQLFKLKDKLEEEVFKYKLQRETKEERKHGILDNINNTNFIHSNRDTVHSSTNNSNTADNNIHSKSDCENNQQIY